MPHTDDEVLIGELMDKAGELSRKLSACMSERDRALSMLRILVNNTIPSSQTDNAIRLLDESRDWK